MNPAGRPEIGQPINIRLEDELLKAVDQLAREVNLSRAATIRALIRDGLGRAAMLPTFRQTKRH